MRRTMSPAFRTASINALSKADACKSSHPSRRATVMDGRGGPSIRPKLPVLGVELPLLRQALQELLPGRKGFPLLLYTRLFVVLTLLDLGENARFLALSLEALQRVLER